MLLLRPEQIALLSADSMERKITDFLREHFPERMARVDRGALKALIRRATAPGAGMVTEREIVRFVMFGLMTHLDFETNPATAWARPVLLDPRRRGEACLDRLFAQARRHGFTVRAMREVA